MPSLAHGLFHIRGMLDENLPYNLNWQSIDWAPLDAHLSANPIYVVDVGARGGSLGELRPLNRYLDIVAFDADVKEVERLNSLGKQGFRGYRALPYFVGGSPGSVTFHLYERITQSSSLLPAASYRHRYEPGMKIVRDVTVQSTTIDAMMEAGEISEVDILKLDTQGTEHEILTAATAALAKALLVEVEVSFVARYEGQKLAFDIERIMHESGFELLYVSRVFRTRIGYRGRNRGQLVNGDMLFGISDARASALPMDRKLKLVVLLIQYGLMDFAHAIYSEAPDLQEASPRLARYFAASPGIFAKVRAGLAMQLDKLIAVLLHMRRTNGCRTDSDRAWPIR